MPVPSAVTVVPGATPVPCTVWPTAIDPAVTAVMLRTLDVEEMAVGLTVWAILTK